MRGMATASALTAGSAASPGGSLHANTPLGGEPAPEPVWKKTPCRLCGVGCGLLVGIQNGRAVAVKGVPDRLHQRLKSRAAASGMSLSDYLRLELERVSTQLTPDEFRYRLSALEPTRVRESVADAVRAERDSR